ncbi:methionine ABC transporter permease [Clostridium sp. WILCCON 0269]|uniref:Methionine ABC transporter permease n=1 Tax=Candidatus Clostridium eludens TaxID=3381663 RepID=A0ABW8SKW5_9CLOT
MTDDFKSLIMKGLWETIEMVIIAGGIALLIGLPLGIILVVTKKGHILEHEKLNKILATIVNAVRSLPSVILIVVLLPLARLVVGTTLGMKAAIVPISIGISPLLARIIETSLEQVEWGKIEAALSVGAKPFQIILRILIPEALPSLVKGVTISIISIIEFTAIAGVIGAGGLGSLAIRFGYQRFRKDIMVATVVILICLVQFIQFSGDRISKHVNKKRYKFD